MPKQQKPHGSNGQPQRSKRGRPRRSAEERAAAKERRIEASFKGRLQFRPGHKHALDVQEGEARNYRALIAAQLEHLQGVQTALNEMDDPGVMVSKEEHALKAFMYEEYRDHKHRDHIAATFLAIRRKRLLARLQAADDALMLATELLTPEPDLLDDLRAAVEHQREVAERRKLQPRTQRPQEDEEVAGPQIENRHIYGDVEKARARLAFFDAQVQSMRAAISPAIGWFEQYFVRKTRMTGEAREYLKRKEPIPPNVEVFVDVWYGPYLKYRWQEVTGGPMYTVQMSLIPEDEIEAAKRWAANFGEEEEEHDNPWPNL